MLMDNTIGTTHCCQLIVYFCILIMENRQMQSPKFFVYFFFCILLLNACNSNKVTPLVIEDTVTNGINLPATAPIARIENSFFTDTVPCEGCPGVVYQLFFSLDTTYMFSEEILGQKQRPTLHYGRYNQSDSMVTLFLSKSRQVKFRIRDTGMLMVNDNQRVLNGNEDFVLGKDLYGKFDLSQSYIIDGAYFYNSSGAIFTPCGQSAIYPVNPGGGGFDAEEIFLKRGKKNKDPIYLSALIRIMETKDLAGMHKVMVSIEKVLDKIDSTDCR